MYSSYNPRRRYQRKKDQRNKKIMRIVLFLGLISGTSYWLGGEAVKSSEYAYKQQFTRVKAENQDLESKVTELLAANQTLQRDFEKLQGKYHSEVPTGELKELSELAKQQLQDGISSERLEFVITSARPPRNCTSPETKRFVIRTPHYRGPDSAVSFVNRSVTVTGSGEPSVSNGGKVQAWFDAGQEVEVKFSQLGGKDTIKKGLLPIHHAMVIGDKEHRFTVSKGNRSFVNVTSDTCDYP